MITDFESYLLKEKRYSEHTVLAYINDLKEFNAFAQIPDELSAYKEVNKQLVRAWIVDLVKNEYKAKSVSRKLSTLRTFYKWLKFNQYIDENPMRLIQAPKVSKRIPEFVQESYLGSEKIAPMFSEDFSGHRDRLLFEMLYQTGIRLSELLNLKETDISSSYNIKVLGKRNKERIVAISEQLYNQINTYLSMKKQQNFNSVFLLLTDKGIKMYPKFVYRKINTYLSRVSSLQKKSPHILRHTFATHLLNNGAQLEVLKEILGHESLAATQIYTHNSFAQINEIYKQAHPRGRKKNDYGS
jgi:integrase/recombinase XerC